MILATDEEISIHLVYFKKHEAIFLITNHREAPVWVFGHEFDGAQIRAAVPEDGRWRRRAGVIDQPIRANYSPQKFIRLAPGDSIEARCNVDPAIHQARFSVYLADHPHTEVSCDCNYLRFRELWTPVVNLQDES